MNVFFIFQRYNGTSVRGKCESYSFIKSLCLRTQGAGRGTELSFRCISHAILPLSTMFKGLKGAKSFWYLRWCLTDVYLYTDSVKRVLGVIIMGKEQMSGQFCLFFVSCKVLAIFMCLFTSFLAFTSTVHGEGFANVLLLLCIVHFSCKMPFPFLVTHWSIHVNISDRQSLKDIPFKKPQLW